MNDRLTRLINALEKEDSLFCYPKNYIEGAINYIKKTADDKKRSVVDCTYSSIVSAIETSAKLQIPIDDRKLGYFEGKFDKSVGKKICQIGIGYQAYFYKLTQTLDDFDGEAFVVYEGDELTTEDKDGFHSYTLKKGDIFSSCAEKVKGVVVRLTYTRGGCKRQKLGFVGIDEIMKIRSKAKYKGIWDEWFSEKAKAAATRRACKGLFDIAIGLQDLMDHDNKSYDLNQIEQKSIVATIEGPQEEDEVKKLIKETGVRDEQIKEWFDVKSVEDVDREELLEYLKD